MQTTAFPLWSGAAPGALGAEPADIPTLTPYLSSNNPTGACVIVFPGGGYGVLAPHEGAPFAEWLASIGVHSFVLQYRLGPKYKHPVMHMDASRAIRTVRARANEWGIDPTRIGIMGFSAGGHLASSASVHFDAGNADATDPIERVSSRPDLSILVYPVISMMDGITHKGSQLHLLGPDASDELKKKMSSELQITPNTPPAFLYHRTHDPAVPVDNPMLYAMAMRRAGVSFELHVYDKAGHGQGFAKNDPVDGDWTERLRQWLKGRSFLAP
jgi:acetyl esterase/lipase